MILWELAARAPQIRFLFASPSSIFEAVVVHTRSLVLLRDTLITAFEATTGFLIGVIVGTFAGYLLWYAPWLARLSRPYLIALTTLPIFALAPLLIIWFGIGIPMKIAVAAIGTFVVALAQSYEGASSVDLEEFHMLQAYGISRPQILRKIIFPAAISWVFASMKLNIGFAFLGAIIGEFIAAQKGLGHFMLLSGSLYDIPAVFAGSVYIIILAFIFHKVVMVLERNKDRFIQVFSVDRRVRELQKTM